MPPVFEGGRLQPGVYKIQNIYTETYLDIHLHSMELCCRPANDLGVGRGLVRPFLQPVTCVSDDWGVGDWEAWGWIRSLAGEPVDTIRSVVY